MIKYIFLLLFLSGCASISTDLYIYDRQKVLILEYSYYF